MGTIRDQQLLARSDRLARDHRVPTRRAAARCRAAAARRAAARCRAAAARRAARRWRGCTPLRVGVGVRGCGVVEEVGHRHLDGHRQG